jgi:hypothetical protein
MSHLELGQRHRMSVEEASRLSKRDASGPGPGPPPSARSKDRYRARMSARQDPMAVDASGRVRRHDGLTGDHGP